MYLLLPFVAAVAFAAGSLAFKRAFQEGASLAHALVVNNIALGIAFLPLMALDPRPVAWDLAHLPALTALAFVTGHLLNVAALRTGDVTVATPLLGAKVVFVALIGWLAFGWPVTRHQILAAALTTSGVLVMGLADLRRGRHTWPTIGLSLGCAAAFALTDVLIQLWASRLGVFNFLSLLFATLALLSAALLPVFGRTSLRASAAAWKWAGTATALSAIQALIITWTIGHWRDAAGVNVVYGTRGLCSLALVWWLGNWVGNTERTTAGPRILALRLVGTLLILGAVAIAVGEARRP